MGRLPLVTLCALVACDKSGDAPPPPRSDQVRAAPGATSAAPIASVSASASAAPKPPRKLCDTETSRTAPKASLSVVETTGAARADVAIPYARASWTWINFWAAWCGPCKEEIPRLRGWETKLNAQGAKVQIAFVSLDDDIRQIQDFLGAQPTMKSTFWLPEGATRTGWLGGLKMKSAPQLPEHALVDASGKVRCFIDGAVEDSDYAEVAALIH